MNLPLTKNIRRLMLILLCILVALSGAGRLMASPGYTPVRNVADGIFNPFAAELSWFSGTTSGFTETTSYTVPSTNRLEITEISAEAYAPGSTAVIMKITTTCGGVTVAHYITNFATNPIYVNYWLMSMTSHHLYVDPGSTVTVDVVRQTPPGASTGYYSDVILTGRLTGL